MGGEMWLRLDKKDIGTVRRWHRSLGEDELCVTVNDVADPDGIRACAHIEFNGTVMEIGYSFGAGVLSGEWATALAGEINKRLNVRNYGWDSVGWVPRKERLRRGFPIPFHFEIEYTIKRFRRNKIKMLYLAPRVDEARTRREQMQKAVHELFERTWPKAQTKQKKKPKKRKTT